MNLSKEEIDKYREGPQEDVVHPICHRILLLVFSLVRHMLVDFWLSRHHELRGVSHREDRTGSTIDISNNGLFGNSEVVNMP
jgi:hypothetical protein